jgi:heme-degrading monooxygenase HmoA
MDSPFVVISKFRVRNGMANEVADAFRKRPHLVDDAPGFLELQVLSPSDDESEFWLVTRWTDEDSFRTWHRSHEYRESHAGIPKGLKLDPTATEVRGFRQIAS